jgi:hypothetical protein
MQIAPKLEPRLGMRYGPDVWHLKEGSLYLERSDRIIPARVKNAGVSPQVPSVAAAVEGIRKCYGNALVMGLDPEFFVRQRGQLVPAFDCLPDKHSTPDGLFWDGFQAESTVRPTNCYENCPRNCQDHLIYCHALLAQRIGKQIARLATKGLEIAPQAVWRVPQRMLELAGEAQVSLGCDPSRNAYGMWGRCVLEPRRLSWRFAGGHIHFTLVEAERTPENIRYLVKTLDALVGIPAVCLAQNYDHFIRRRYYGLAGEYRLPAHGLEWRTLSNFWIMHPRAFMLVFDLARHALNVGRARLRNVFVGATNESAIAQTINYCDVKSARDFMRLNEPFYSRLMLELYGSKRAFWQAIEGGIDSVIPQWGQNVVGDWQAVNQGDWRKVPAWKDLG